MASKAITFSGFYILLQQFLLLDLRWSGKRSSP